MKKKIAILTQPLHDNYGGLLQAYALSKYVNQFGDVLIIDRWSGYNAPLKRFAARLKRILVKNALAPNKKQKRIISKNTFSFKKKYIPNLSEKITTDAGMRKLNKKGFDTYIVGSDQCWRPKYSPNITNFFLDFVKGDKAVTRISYAASFGTSDWEFDGIQTELCKKLIQKFDAVSVREQAGAELCKTYLDREAIHLLDPTMLLKLEDYHQIVHAENVQKSKGELMVYILDKTEEKNNLVDYISSKMKFQHFETLPKKRIGKEQITSTNIIDFVYPSPADWLRGFQDAHFVITDSFHGTVFSLLHNVPFIAIGNAKRGLARFESLLQKFGLENRLLFGFTEDKVDKILEERINWFEVNEIVNFERKKATNYLNTYLT